MVRQPETARTEGAANARAVVRSGASAQPFRWGMFFAYLTSFCIVAMVLGIVVAFSLGVRPLEARAEQIVSTEPPSIIIHWPAVSKPAASAAPDPLDAMRPDSKPVTTWLPLSDQQGLLTLAKAAFDGDGGALSPDPIARVATAMAQSGWFVGTPTIRRERGNVIRIDGAWRIPAAVVRSEGRDHLLSWDAMPMPASYEPGEARLPVIFGPSVGRPMKGGAPDLSTAWPGEDIAASLELLQLISSQAWFSQVAGIDASRFSSEEVLTIISTWNTRVVWGGRPTRPRVGEVSTRQKLINIAQLHHDSKRIDSGYPEIQIFGRWILLDNSAGAKSASEGQNATATGTLGPPDASGTAPSTPAQPAPTSPATPPAADPARPRGPTTLGPVLPQVARMEG